MELIVEKAGKDIGELLEVLGRGWMRVH